jgi:hypothetical protein
VLEPSEHEGRFHAADAVGTGGDVPRDASAVHRQALSGRGIQRALRSAAPGSQRRSDIGDQLPGYVEHGPQATGGVLRVEGGRVVSRPDHAPGRGNRLSLLPRPRATAWRAFPFGQIERGSHTGPRDDWETRPSASTMPISTTP